ncbi:hypothetical protein IVB45_02130 [Bradyrhizobium sp. 4]|uniref:hypothetical protein n=1 Tax=Bradyrhizobium sp. 4 TaxID=2782678 RepID=UPI0020004600|nr:hypothetical protein [Bradyrhizobium sp. 4]UPJ35832.1 hypothetical protein IVB45_02130 [Bradyrhizobium sp. 4]
MQNDNWLPEGYEAPKTAGGNYAKLEDGANKFRILSSPVIGFLYWTNDNKPTRLKARPETLPEDIRVQNGVADKVKHFWAFAVWNYRDSKVQILEITQASIQGPIEDLVTNDDWGNPQAYDIAITKKGQKLDTEYSVQPSPHRDVPVEAQAALRATPVNLAALFTGGDPFAPVDGITREDTPFN